MAFAPYFVMLFGRSVQRFFAVLDTVLNGQKYSASCTQYLLALSSVRMYSYDRCKRTLRCGPPWQCLPQPGFVPEVLRAS